MFICIRIQNGYTNNKRGRSYEQEISASYLGKINSGYLDYITIRFKCACVMFLKVFVKNQRIIFYIR
jgi:hypothetical protein